MTAISEAMTIFDVVPCPSTPVTHFAVVLAPRMDGLIANGNLGSMASLALEVRGLVHVAVNAMMDMSYSVSSGEMVQAPVHS